MPRGLRWPLLVAAIVAVGGSTLRPVDAPAVTVVVGTTAFPPQTSFTSVSCASTADCTAVGELGHGPDVPSLFDAATYRPVYATEQHGAWERAVALPAPAGSVFTGVSCSSAADCTAVGYDFSGSFDVHASESVGNPIYARETRGRWGPVKVIASISGTGFTSVSCTSASDCTAVGTNALVSPTSVGPIVATETAGRWGRLTVLAIGPADLNGVSCTGAGECTAVGDDLLLNGQFGYFYANEPIAVTESAGTWSTAVAFAASDGAGQFNGVSCSHSGECTAVGNGPDGAIFASESAGVWGPTASAPSSMTYATFQAVSCTDATACTSVGAISTTGPGGVALDSMRATESGGVWTAPSAEGLGSFDGVSCTAAAACTAVGAYDLCQGATCRGPSSYPVYVTTVAGTWPAVPAAPRSTRVTAADRSLEVRWAAVASGGAPALSGYTAEATSSSRGVLHEHFCSTTRTGCTIAGLSKGTTYTVVVYARDPAGPSAASSAKQAVPRA